MADWYGFHKHLINGLWYSRKAFFFCSIMIMMIIIFVLLQLDIHAVAVDITLGSIFWYRSVKVLITGIFKKLCESVECLILDGRVQRFGHLVKDGQSCISDFFFFSFWKLNHRSQCPRGLSMNSFRPLKHWDRWFRIPLEALMFACVYSVFVFSFVQVATLRLADPPSKESCRLCKRSGNWKRSQGPKKGGRAIDK
jgi:hypothetical protein